jgi:hypothetical protein
MKISHGAVHADVMSLIDCAQKRLVLVSPFIDLWPGLVTALKRAETRGVEITLIARGGDTKEKNQRALRQVRNVCRYVGFVERLHAKVYLNEAKAILTSMNLVQSSALNSIEISAFVESQWATKEYAQLKRICDALIDTARQDELRSERPHDDENDDDGDDNEVVVVPRGPRGRPPKWGHCIRCEERIEFDMMHPLCDGCFTSWNRYKNKDYEECYCHKCGEECATTFADPICEDC